MEWHAFCFNQNIRNGNAFVSFDIKGYLLQCAGILQVKWRFFCLGLPKNGEITLFFVKQNAQKLSSLTVKHMKFWFG